MKRTIVLLITLLVSLVALFSCKTKEPTNDTTPDTEDLAVYGSGIETVLITNIDLVDNESMYDCFSSIADEIYSQTGNYPYTYVDAKPQSAHEIVVGDTSRPITVKAKELLAKKLEKEIRNSVDEEAAREDLVGYAIYAEGGSVAIVWSDWHLDEVSVNYLLENYITESSLTLKDGYLKTETLSLNEYLEDRGNRIREEQWAALEEAIGEEYGSKVVSSMRKLYTIYKPEAISWLANLYDADIGGFYWSNSARNTMGYLPDLESTGGALGFVEASGMAEMFDNDYSKALPSWMLKQIGEWVQGLQNEDGYFYHPQWPKEYLYERGLQTRMTRDRGSAVTILRKLGLSATYSTSAVVLSGRLSAGRDAVSAVSKVIPTAGMLSQFESVEKFQEYINIYDDQVLAIKDPDERAYKLYSIGNEFQTTWQQVNANPEYVTILYEFFKKHQDPNTGTWSSVLTYNATNSLHKIGYVYNALGIKFEYVDQMVKTVIEILSRDVQTDPAEAYVEIMNAWASLEHIYTNIRKCSATPAEAEEKLAEVKNYVYANITKAIDATASQLAGFMQQDGSFGYSRYGSTSVSQGCPVAVANTAEGDVNGFGGITTSLTGYIADALDLSEYEVKIYSEKERVEFVRILEDLGSIIKDEDKLYDDVPLTFDDGIIPEQILIEASAERTIFEGASVSIENVDGDNVFRVVAVGAGVPNQMNHQITVPINLTSTQANAAVMEFDLCVYDKGSTAWYSMIQWTMRNSGAIVLNPNIGKTSDGKVVLYDGKGAVICELGNVDERIKFRFEYYWAEGEYKVYVDDMLKGKGNTLYAASLINKPLTDMIFYTPTSLYANYYIDNLRCSRVEKVYDPDGQIQYPKPVTEDFEGEVTSEQYGNGYNVRTENDFSAVYPSDRTNDGGATAVVRTDEATGNKFLSVYAPGRDVVTTQRAHSIGLATAAQTSDEVNTYVFEASLKLNSISTSGDFLQIVFRGNGGRYGQLNMTTKKVNDVEMVCLAGLPIGYYDQWFDLRLEYYMEEGVIRAYNNDLYMGEITTFSQADNTTKANGLLVSNIDSVSGFSLGLYNASGSLSLSMDNLTVYTAELEYTEREVDTLPAPNPDPDNFIPDSGTTPAPEEPGTGTGGGGTDQPGTGGGTTPDVEFSGMEPPMSIPDDVTPVDPDLEGDEDMGDWT